MAKIKADIDLSTLTVEIKNERGEIIGDIVFPEQKPVAQGNANLFRKIRQVIPKIQMP